MVDILEKFQYFVLLKMHTYNYALKLSKKFIFDFNLIIFLVVIIKTSFYFKYI